MAYSTNPYLPHARAAALRLLVEEGVPSSTVALRAGVHRSTVWRWKQKWNMHNQHVQLANANRPHRMAGVRFRLSGYRWLIPTLSSRPRTSPKAIGFSIVERVLVLRATLKRCAEVIWYHLTQIGDEHGTVSISLSSVRRILRRHHYFDGARRPRVKRDNPRRPQVTKPGELVETDTIHHVDPYSGRRRYYYTVIDLCTRMTYVTVAPQLRQGLAAQAVLEAQEAFGFLFQLVQSDNGPEYSRYFEARLAMCSIKTRHTRLHRPNDNAHIERFNRTLQEECIGHSWRRSVPLQRQRDALAVYLDYYNTKRVHLGVQMRTPAAVAAEMLHRL